MQMFVVILKLCSGLIILSELELKKLYVEKLKARSLHKWV